MSRNQWIGLGIVLSIIAGLYLLVYAGQRLPPIEVRAMNLADGGVVFRFNDEVTVEEVMVFRPAEDADPDDELAYIEGDMMWHLIPREPDEGDEPSEPATIDSLKYGRFARGLQRAEGIPRRGRPLESGTRYVFVATLAEGRSQIEFTYVGDDG